MNQIHQLKFCITSNLKHITTYGVLINVVKKEITIKRYVPMILEPKYKVDKIHKYKSEFLKPMGSNIFEVLTDFEPEQYPEPIEVISRTFEKEYIAETETFENIINEFKDVEFPVHKKEDLISAYIIKKNFNDTVKYNFLRWNGDYRPWKVTVNQADGTKTVYINCASNPLMNITWDDMMNESKSKEIIEGYNNKRRDIFDAIKLDGSWNHNWIVNSEELSLKSISGTHYQC